MEIFQCSASPFKKLIYKGVEKPSAAQLSQGLEGKKKEQQSAKSRLDQAEGDREGLSKELQAKKDQFSKEYAAIEKRNQTFRAGIDNASKNIQEWSDRLEGHRAAIKQDILALRKAEGELVHKNPEDYTEPERSRISYLKDQVVKRNGEIATLESAIHREEVILNGFRQKIVKDINSEVANALGIPRLEAQLDRRQWDIKATKDLLKSLDGIIAQGEAEFVLARGREQKEQSERQLARRNRLKAEVDGLTEELNQFSSIHEMPEDKKEEFLADLETLGRSIRESGEQYGSELDEKFSRLEGQVLTVVALQEQAEGRNNVAIGTTKVPLNVREGTNIKAPKVKTILPQTEIKYIAEPTISKQGEVWVQLADNNGKPSGKFVAKEYHGETYLA